MRWVQMKVLAGSSVVVGLLFLLTLSNPLGAAPVTASQTLQRSVDQVLALLKVPGLNTAERRERLRVLIEERFDFKTMSRFALSVYWRKASASQRAAFIKRFTRMVESTYLGRMDQYRDQAVEIRGEKKRGRKVFVSTVIVTGRVDIPIIYKMLHQGSDWRIYDVVIEGISLIRNYRDSYRGIIRKEGINGLLARMDKKIAELEAAH